MRGRRGRSGRTSGSPYEGAQQDRRSDAGRAGVAVRDRVRDLRRDALRAYLPRLSVLWLGLLVVGVPLVLIQGSGFARGFFAAMLLAYAVAAPLYVWAINGLLHRAMGADAEEATSRALRALDRRSWVVIDDLMFDRGNVDHVVVGPSRQVFVIESKWCSLGVRTEPQLDRWTRQAAWAAGRIGKLLSTRGLSRHVTPVVLVWGPRVRVHGKTLVQHQEVTVVTGAGVDELLARIRHRAPGIELDHPAVHALEAFGAQQDEWFERGSARR